MNKKKLNQLTSNDPYLPLEKNNSQESKKLISRESAKMGKEMKKYQHFEKFYEEFKELNSAPTQDTTLETRYGLLTLAKSTRGNNITLFFTKRNGKKKELIDIYDLDKSGKSSVIEYLAPSPDDSIVAFQLQKADEEFTTLYLVNILTGDIIDQPISNVRDTPILWRSTSTFFYVREVPVNEKGAVSERVFSHVIGSKITKDTLIYGEGNSPEKFLHIDLSDDYKYLLITEIHGAQDDNEVLLAYLAPHKNKPIKIKKIWSYQKHLSMTTLHGRDGIIYGLRKSPAHGGELYLYDASINEDWKLLLKGPESEEITDFTLSNKYIFIETSKDTLSKLYRSKISSPCDLEPIILPYEGVISGLTHNDTKPGNVTFLFENGSTPPREYIYNERSKNIRNRYQDVVTEYEENITFKQIQIPVKGYGYITANLLYRSDQELSNLSTMFYIYGGFSDILKPEYRTSPMLWAHHGGLWVDLHIRGGAEQGEKHHIAAIKEKKINGLSDIITGVNYLIEQGYAAPDKIGIRGASNGGLLSAIAMIKRPDLFKAVISESGPLDMIRYPLGGMGKNWIEEYGDPTDAQQYPFLERLSPYHNIAKVIYPKTLFATFAKDERVPNWHGFKMVAKLNKESLNPQDIYHYHGLNSGHSGGVAEEEDYYDALSLAFAAHYLKLPLDPKGSPEPKLVDVELPFESDLPSEKIKPLS